MDVRTEILRGTEGRRRLDELAALRIGVFRDFPYLYDGDIDYERRYLDKYATSPNSVFVLAVTTADDRVVGAATGLPLVEADAEFQQPFLTHGLDPGTVFYFGESVLDRRWRGRGLGHAFFDGREAFARALGFAVTAFCAVVRPADHPARPDDYRPLDAFWNARGYFPVDGMVTRYLWRDLDEEEESAKTMQFWLRRA